jgi:hypothetical protein
LRPRTPTTSATPCCTNNSRSTVSTFTCKVYINHGFAARLDPSLPVSSYCLCSADKELNVSRSGVGGDVSKIKHDLPASYDAKSRAT